MCLQEKIFVYVFCLLLYIPMCGIDYKSEKSVQENRALATLPKIVKDRSVNKQFGKCYLTAVNILFI